MRLMTRVALALAFALGAVVPAAAHAGAVCAVVPNGDGHPAYVCTDPTTEGCLLYGWLGEEAGFGPRDCEYPG